MRWKGRPLIELSDEELMQAERVAGRIFKRLPLFASEDLFFIAAHGWIALTHAVAARGLSNSA